VLSREQIFHFKGCWRHFVEQGNALVLRLPFSGPGKRSLIRDVEAVVTVEHIYDRSPLDALCVSWRAGNIRQIPIQLRQ